MININQLKRVFVIGGTRVADHHSDLPLKDSIRLLSKDYPQFRHTRIYDEDGVVEGDELVFTLKAQPLKTNG